MQRVLLSGHGVTARRVARDRATPPGAPATCLLDRLADPADDAAADRAALAFLTTSGAATASAKASSGTVARASNASARAAHASTAQCVLS